MMSGSGRVRWATRPHPLRGTQPLNALLRCGDTDVGLNLVGRQTTQEHQFVAVNIRGGVDEAGVVPVGLRKRPLLAAIQTCP